jgi:curli biogenesis system outer membrane secretion channel CsgG
MMLRAAGTRWVTRMLSAAVLLVPASSIAAQAASNDTRPTVAVLYFTNGALVDNASYAALSKGMAEMLITELAQNTGIRVVERDRIQTLIEEQNLQNSDRVDKETAIRMGKTLGARHMLMGAFVIDMKENIRIDIRAVNTETSAIEYTEKVEGKADQFLSLVMQLGAKVNQGLKLPALKTASITAPAAKNPNQFRAIMAMSRAIEAEDRNDIPKAIVEYKSAIALNPDMDRARVRLASIERP